MPSAPPPAPSAVLMSPCCSHTQRQQVRDQSSATWTTVKDRLNQVHTTAHACIPLGMSDIDPCLACPPPTHTKISQTLQRQQVENQSYDHPDNASLLLNCTLSTNMRRPPPPPRARAPSFHTYRGSKLRISPTATATMPLCCAMASSTHTYRSA